MRSLIVLFASLILVAPLSASHALIFGADRRMSVATDPGSLFSPVGVVYGLNGGYATAFLVDDCHALTVQHAFGEHRTAKGVRTVAAFNVDGSPSSWSGTRAIVVAEGGIEANTVPGIEARENDWALLRLNKCLGRTFGHVRLAARRAASTEVIGIAGYPSDRPLSEGLAIDIGCRVRGVRSLTILHDCAALPGNSGSPLFRIAEVNGTPRLEVFAISEAAHSVADLGRNTMDKRDNYPDAVWNLATTLCGNASLAAARLDCSPR